MKKTIAKLYCLQLQYDGIPDSIYEFFTPEEQKMLKEVNGKSFLKEEYRKQITIVLTGGVFDILHIGHVYTLEEAKKHGDVLVVVVAKDQHIKNKKRKLIHSQEYRTKMVEFLKPVDVSLLGREDPKEVLEFVKPDIVVFGYDQEVFINSKDIKIIKLEKRLEEDKFKTSKIIEELGV
jgi:cytidyltransferase-like protein